MPDHLPCGEGRSSAVRPCGPEYCMLACGPVGCCGARPVGGGLRAPRPLLLGFEHLLAYAALGAGPVVGQLLKRGAGCDAVVGIADRRVVNPVADGAFVLFHCLFFLVEHALRRRGACRFSVVGAYCVPECGCEGRFFFDYFV